MLITLMIFISVNLSGCGDPIAIFHETIRSGDIENAQVLLAEDSTLTNAIEGGQTPLFEALGEDQKQIALLLINNGADVNVKDKKDRTPLYIAIKNDHVEVVNLIRKYGGVEQ